MALKYTPKTPQATRTSFWQYLRNVNYLKLGVALLVISLLLNAHGIAPLVFSLVFSAFTMFVMLPVMLYVAYKVIPLFLGSRPSELTQSELEVANQGIEKLSSTLSILEQMSKAMSGTNNDDLGSHLISIQDLEEKIGEHRQDSIEHITQNEPTGVRTDPALTYTQLLMANRLRQNILCTYIALDLDIPPILNSKIDVLPHQAPSGAPSR